VLESTFDPYRFLGFGFVAIEYSESILLIVRYLILGSVNCRISREKLTEACRGKGTIYFPSFHWLITCLVIFCDVFWMLWACCIMYSRWWESVYDTCVIYIWFVRIYVWACGTLYMIVGIYIIDCISIDLKIVCSCIHGSG
jgi:hypothetical protein